MKSLLKILAWAIGVVAVLIVAAIIVIPMVFDPNDYRDQITEQVKAKTGRDLEISGDIGLTVFPWLGAELGVVELGNAKGFSDPYFARIEKANVRVKLMPLLSRQIEMDTVTVHGLALNLEKDANGHTNWDDLAGEAEQEGPTGPDDAGGGPGIAALAIGGLDVRDAKLSWKDAQSGQTYKVSRLDLKTGALALGEPVDLEVGVDLEGGEPRMTANVEARAKVAVDADARRYDLTDFQVEADLTGEQFPGAKAKAKLAAKVVYDGKAQTMAVEDLLVELLDLVLTGKLAAKDLDKGGSYDGVIKIAEFNPRELMKALGQTPPETADAKALTVAAVDATLSGTQKSVSLKPLALRLDDSRLTGELAVADIASSALRFDLVLDAIDADRYLPPAREGEAPAAATPGAAASGAGELPMEQLRALDVDGSFKAGKLKVSNLTVTDVSMKLKAKDGVIKLSPIAAKLYEGGYAGDIGIDARKDQPKLSINEKLSKVQAGPLLADLLGEERLTGALNANAKLTATGVGGDAFKRSLNGKGGFAFTEGALKGVNIPQMIRDAKAKMSGGTAAKATGPQQTDFSVLRGTFDIKNGLATNNDLSAKSPLLRIEGKGTADLPKDTIDYRTKTTVVATTKGQGGDDLADLAGIPIPLMITGSLSKPEYGLDYQALVTAVAQSKAKDLLKGGDVTEKLGTSLGGVVGGSTGGSGSSDTGGSSSGGGLGGAIGGGLKGLLGN